MLRDLWTLCPLPFSNNIFQKHRATSQPGYRHGYSPLILFPLHSSLFVWGFVHVQKSDVVCVFSSLQFYHAWVSVSTTRLSIVLAPSLCSRSLTVLKKHTQVEDYLCSWNLYNASINSFVSKDWNGMTTNINIKLMMVSVRNNIYHQTLRRYRPQCIL